MSYVVYTIPKSTHHNPLRFAGLECGLSANSHKGERGRPFMIRGGTRRTATPFIRGGTRGIATATPSVHGGPRRTATAELQLQHLLSTKGHEGPRRPRRATKGHEGHEGPRRATEGHGGQNCNCRRATATSFVRGGTRRTLFFIREWSDRRRRRVFWGRRRFWSWNRRIRLGTARFCPPASGSCHILNSHFQVSTTPHHHWRTRENRR